MIFSNQYREGRMTDEEAVELFRYSMPRYEVRVGDDEWQATTYADKQPSGFPHYELRDGTTGLAHPKDWRAR